MPLDMVKDQESDLADLLRGDAALLDASKKGDLDRVSKCLHTSIAWLCHMKVLVEYDVVCSNHCSTTVEIVHKIFITLFSA